MSAPEPKSRVMVEVDTCGKEQAETKTGVRLADVLQDAATEWVEEVNSQPASDD